MSDKVDSFVQQESQQIEQQRQEAIKASGGLPYLPAIQQGETKLHLYREIPKDGKYGKLFKVKYDGSDYAWTIRQKSPLYREVVKALAKGEVRGISSHSSSGPLAQPEKTLRSQRLAISPLSEQALERTIQGTR